MDADHSQECPLPLYAIAPNFPIMGPRGSATGRVVALWAGIAVAWGAVLVVVYLQLPDHLVSTMVLASVLAVLGGVLGTVRIRASVREPLITVEDLRRR